MEATLQSGRRRTIRSLFFSTRPSLIPKTRRERTTRHSHSEETLSRAVSSCRAAAPARAAARTAQPLQRHGALLPLGQRRDPRPGRRRLELAAARFQVHALRGPSVIIGRRINDQRSEISGDLSDLGSWASPPPSFVSCDMARTQRRGHPPASISSPRRAAALTATRAATRRRFA